jgi:hypothetical protein
VSEGRSASVSGIFPDKRFREKSTVCKFRNRLVPISDGTNPCRAFPCSLKDVSELGHCAISTGINPVNALLCSITSVSLVPFPRLGGIAFVNLFLDRSSETSDGHGPEGIDPVKSFTARETVHRFGALASEVGTLP